MNNQKQLILAAPRGFCAGVKRAIDTADAVLQKFGRPVYCLNEIVHNRQVVKKFAADGVIFVRRIADVPDESILMFSAHGVPPAARTEAAEKKLKVIDATCPFVSKVHQEAIEYARRGYSVFLIGKHGHDEVLGVAGEAPDHVMVVETEAEALTVIPSNPDKTAIITQTTLSDYETAIIRSTLIRRFPKAQSPDKSDICYATRNRQKAVQAVARLAEVVFVLGSHNSSNSRRLVEVAEQEGIKALLIPDLKALKINISSGLSRIGLTAGASVPEEFIAAAIGYLQSIGYTKLREIVIADENVSFTLPKEINPVGGSGGVKRK